MEPWAKNCEILNGIQALTLINQSSWTSSYDAWQLWISLPLQNSLLDTWSYLEKKPTCFPCVIIIFIHDSTPPLHTILVSRHLVSFEYRDHIFFFFFLRCFWWRPFFKVFYWICYNTDSICALVFGPKARGISAPRLGMELAPSCTGRWRLNHWATSEVPRDQIFLPDPRISHARKLRAKEVKVLLTVTWWAVAEGFHWKRNC